VEFEDGNVIFVPVVVEGSGKLESTNVELVEQFFTPYSRRD
jgi:hypothetical protein